MATSRCKAIRSLTTFSFSTALALLLVTSHICTAQQITATPVENNFHNEPDKSIVLNVTVTNERGHFIAGLGKANFTLYDGKAPQEFTFLGRKDVPVSVNILLDISGSINEDRSMKKVGFIKDALSAFIKASNSSNEYFLTVFSSTAQVIGGAHTAETVLADADKILSARFHGQTAFYDACFTGIEQVMRGVHSKRVVFVISDGEDNRSQHKFKDVLRLLKDTNVILYAVNVVSDGNKKYPLAEEGHHHLQELARASGGIVYIPTKIEDINLMAEYIAEELRKQYALSFNPARDANGKEWHRLEVKATLPPESHLKVKRTVVRTREGYFGRRIVPYFHIACTD
ncbi:MAG: VWA domain-containing protein [Pyrinomonadaceae bacterium]